MKNEPVDVLIIGAGASGAAVAWSLSDSNMRILCLDQGPRINRAKFPSKLPDYELHRYAEFSCDPNVRKLPQDYPVNADDSPITPVNFNGVGGSTVNYLAHWPRFHPSNFRTRTLDGVADDWPIDYQTLEPFYAINDRMMGVSGLPGNPAYPSYEPPHPPITIGKLGQTLANGFNKLGWHWWPSDVAILSRDTESRRKCRNAGVCDLGCAIGAKASVDITYWPQLEKCGVILKPGCRVREITMDPNGKAGGVLYYNEQGQLQEQRAGIVILACNGIGTPRLMLNSKSKQFPDGIANRNGMVGKNLMFHPLSGVVGIFGEPMEGFKGPMACSILSQEFYETNPSHDFVRGYGLHSGRYTTPMTYALGGYGTDRLIPWGDEHRKKMDEVYPYLAGLTVVTEDLPLESNQVTLDPELTDSHGIPAPKISYTVDNNTRRMFAHGEARAQEALLAAGAREIIMPEGNIWRRAGWHQMGTARMGVDPEWSVVDSWGRCHDVKNLFIVDGSIFTTSAAVNPTSTIQALALYVGDCIKRNRNKIFD
ncbi:MAG: GMC family oxidoreductase [Desulfocapsaceae bacterium]